MASGRSLHLAGVYNREDGGELSLDVTIPINGDGAVILKDGVAIAHMRAHIERLIYLHAHREVRYGRLQHRDPYRRGPEAEERFRLTEAFEQRYFREYMSRADIFMDNSNCNPVLMSGPPELDQL